tara:strand:- start:598 stop:882 length:285 start_codon:yes stop_codon:yes gene_type:complete
MDLLKKWWFWTIIIIIILILYFIISSVFFDPCDKYKYCESDNDCKYIDFTGACYHPNYFQECYMNRNDGASDRRLQPREGVTCTCEANKCITHG